MTHPDVDPGDGLYWGVKESFREYVSQIPDGVQTRTGLVDDDLDRAVGFPQSSSNITTDASGPATGDVHFSGELGFTGYRGVLAVSVRNPRVHISRETVELSADIAPRGFPETRAVLATARPVDPSRRGDVLVWSRLPAELTEDGARLLGGVYSAGDPADAITIRTRHDAT